MYSARSYGQSLIHFATRTIPTAINTDPMTPIMNQSLLACTRFSIIVPAFFAESIKTNTTFGTAPKHCPLGVASNAKLCRFLLTLYVVCATLLKYYMLRVPEALQNLCCEFESYCPCIFPLYDLLQAGRIFFYAFFSAGFSGFPAGDRFLQCCDILFLEAKGASV